MVLAGCANGVFPVGGSELASSVAARAIEVATVVGGSEGYGGTVMTGYLGHMPMNMGFESDTDLAAPDGVTLVHLHNESEIDGTFHVAYLASHMGLDEMWMDVDVPAGETVTVELPCSEIVGLGELTVPGAVGCHLVDDTEVDNTMSVPGFLGLDYVCGGAMEHYLTPDVDDLDGDGDTEELILFSEAMKTHLSDGGPTGHTHGFGTGMMGMHGF